MGKLSAYLVVGLLWCCLGVFVHAQQVKVMQWNVLEGQGRKSNNTNAQAQAIARIVNYNQPDILLFNEVDASNQSAAVNEAAIIDWVTNNIPYLGTQPGVTFFVKASSQSDGFERNAAVSRFPILAEVTYSDGLRGLHSLRLQLAGANQLQVYHAHLKCCNDTSATPTDCQRRQTEAQFDSDIIRAWAATNSLPYIFAGDWNEDEANSQCVLTSTYRPITMIRTNASLVEFLPTSLNGNSKTISTATTNPTRRFDYCLAASNRLAAVSGYVFNTKVWAANGLYSNATDSATASDHYCVFVNYFLPTDIYVIQTEAFSSVGSQGGPFNPSNQVYTLANAGTLSADWRVTKTASWLDIAATNGTLSAGGNTNITVSINSSASTLSQGIYTDTIRFSNTVTGLSIPRSASLAVYLPPMASFTANPTNGTEVLTVTFTDTSTGDISNRFWNFGDANTINTTTNVVMHTYTAGNYNVTLIASGPVGVSTNTKANYINVLTAIQVWQLQYFGCTNCPQAQLNADPDGDGQDNQTEFLTGTDPTNNVSAFRIISILEQGTNTIITWRSAGGRTNFIQGSVGDLDNNSPSYSNLFYDMSAPMIIPASGEAVTNFVDDGVWWGDFSNSPARYYRIRMRP